MRRFRGNVARGIGGGVDFVVVSLIVTRVVALDLCVYLRPSLVLLRCAIHEGLQGTVFISSIVTKTCVKFTTWLNSGVGDSGGQSAVACTQNGCRAHYRNDAAGLAGEGLEIEARCLRPVR